MITIELRASTLLKLIREGKATISGYDNATCEQIDIIVTD